MHGPLAEAGVDERSRGIERRFHSDDFDRSVSDPGEKNGLAKFDGRFRQYRGGRLANIQIRLAEEGNPLQTVANDVTRPTRRLIQQAMLGQSLEQAVARRARNVGGALHVYGRNSPSGIGNRFQNCDEPIQMHEFHLADMSLK